MGVTVDVGLWVESSVPDSVGEAEVAAIIGGIDREKLSGRSTSSHDILQSSARVGLSAGRAQVRTGGVRPYLRGPQLTG